MTRKLTLEEFVSRSRKVHGDKYNYSKTSYKNSVSKVKIICPEHGEFEQTPSTHFKSGCPKCGDTKLDNEKFIIKAKKKHGDIYDYSLIDYQGCFSRVNILCPHHGIFKIKASAHLEGIGCSKCAGNNKKTTCEFIEQATLTHGNKYDYSLVEYKNNCSKVKIICPIHGVFEQNPSKHMHGDICKKCCVDTFRSNAEDFIVKSRKVHGDKYGYESVEYVKSDKKVKILCHKHGYFLQRPGCHLNGKGCKRCSNNTSKQEIIINDFINTLGFETILRDTKIVKGIELDIYIPEKKLAIEYNGNYWHSHHFKEKNFHLNKLERCNKSGISLFSIFEGIWVNNQEIIKNKIVKLLKPEKRPIIDNIKVSQLEAEECIDFLVQNNLNGDVKSDIRLGLTYKNKITSVLALKINNESTYTITAFCDDLINCNQSGILLEYFEEKYKPNRIEIKADRCYCEDRKYINLGFTKLKHLKPKCNYYNRIDRITKSNYHKSIKIEKNKSHLLKIYDCGYSVYMKNYIGY